MSQKKDGRPEAGMEQGQPAERQEHRDPFARFKFDEPIPPGGRTAKTVLLVLVVLGFFGVQRFLGCDSWGDWAMVWAGMFVLWIFLDGCITVACAQSFFEQGNRLKKYMMARFAQLVRIEFAVLLVAVISYVGSALF